MFVLQAMAFEGLVPVSLRIGAGECIGLNGESGCGKSRLLRALADMDEHSGSASLDGVACETMPPAQWRRRVALLPAESQWWHDTVGEHFERRDTVQADLSVLGFDVQVFDWQVSRCSSGEKQRLAILRLLASRPEVLLLDEPTANLDPDNTVRVEKLILRYLAQRGAACLWVSHDVLQLQRVAARHYQCIDGELREVRADV